MNEIEKQTMDASAPGFTEAKTEPKEASTPNTGLDDWSGALAAAGARDESEEVEGTFTVSGGEVVEEQEKKAVVLDQAPSEDEDTLNNQEVVAVTENGKEIQIVKHPKFSGFLVQFRDGGIVPEELTGTWTSYEQAMIAVRVYIGKRNSAI